MGIVDHISALSHIAGKIAEEESGIRARNALLDPMIKMPRKVDVNGNNNSTDKS